MDTKHITNILQFMQLEDPNGMWLEWLDEISHNESTFDHSYVLETLVNWYNDSKDEKFIPMINLVSAHYI